MKFFLFWLGMTLAGFAQLLLFAAAGGVSQGHADAIGYFLLAIPFTAAAWFVVFAWAQRHRRLV